MISYSNEEILHSIIYALLYGLAFSFFNFCFDIANTFFLSIFYRVKIVRKEDNNDIVLAKNRTGLGGFLVFMKIFLFSLGFMVLSYVALDGVVRIYMLVLCFASFYLAKNMIFNRVLDIFEKGLDNIMAIIYTFLIDFVNRIKGKKAKD